MLLLARATQFLSTRAVADDARFLLQQTARVYLPTRVARVERGRVRAGLEAPPLGQNFKPPRRGYLGQDFRSDERQIPERVLGLQVDAAARERDRDGALRAVLRVDAERRADAPQPRLVGRRRAEPEPLACAKIIQ